MSDMELAKRVARLEGALSALLAELYGRNDTQADMRRLKERDPDVHSLLSGEPCVSESRAGGPLDAALQRLGNAVACVSSRDYPHVVADGTMALREVELGVEALRTALRPFALLAASHASDEEPDERPVNLVNQGTGDKWYSYTTPALTRGDLRRAAAVLGAPERDLE